MKHVKRERGGKRKLILEDFVIIRNGERMGILFTKNVKRDRGWELILGRTGKREKKRGEGEEAETLENEGT